MKKRPDWTAKPHEHFCGKCFPKQGGWWRCCATPCTRPQTCACKDHQEKPK